MLRKTSIFFIIFAWSIHAATTFNVVKTPVPVFLTQNQFFDPVVLITENQLGIAFLYDSTAHSIYYSLLQKNSSTWSTPSLIISNAYSSPSACIDDQGSGAVCTTSTTGVTVVRFQANTSNLATIDKTDFNCQGASAPVVCVGGPGKQVIAWKQNSVTPNQYYIGFSPSYNSSTWNVLDPILPSQGNAHDFCLVGNMGGDCVFIWND